MPAGKGTYGSKVGRPKKKKMYGGGAAKSMAKSLTPMKKGGTKKKKKLDKYQDRGEITKLMKQAEDVSKSNNILNSDGTVKTKEEWRRGLSPGKAGAMSSEDARKLYEKAKSALASQQKLMGGGSVINAKTLRNYSRGGARKNR
mgnify:CR=1 FL=1